MFKTSDKHLYYKEQPIYQTPTAPLLAADFGDKALIYYDALTLFDKEGPTENSTQNILMIDKTGTVIWRIRNSFENPIFWIGAYDREDSWYATDYSDYEVLLDLSNGNFKPVGPTRFGMDLPPEKRIKLD